ncbi:hypothetical protein GIB67_041535, partial [Kingdonia uniflora]
MFCEIYRISCFAFLYFDGTIIMFARSFHSENIMAFYVELTHFVMSSHPVSANKMLNSMVFVDWPVKESAYELLFDRAMGFAPVSEYWRNLRRTSFTQLFNPRRTVVVAPFLEQNRGKNGNNPQRESLVELKRVLNGAIHGEDVTITGSELSKHHENSLPREDGGAGGLYKGKVSGVEANILWLQGHGGTIVRLGERALGGIDQQGAGGSLGIYLLVDDIIAASAVRDGAFLCVVYIGAAAGGVRRWWYGDKVDGIMRTREASRMRLIDEDDADINEPSTSGRGDWSSNVEELQISIDVPLAIVAPNISLVRRSRCSTRTTHRKRTYEQMDEGSNSAEARQLTAKQKDVIQVMAESMMHLCTTDPKEAVCRAKVVWHQ